jgi:hypothetical protein
MITPVDVNDIGQQLDQLGKEQQQEFDALVRRVASGENIPVRELGRALFESGKTRAEFLAAIEDAAALLKDQQDARDREEFTRQIAALDQRRDHITTELEGRRKALTQKLSEHLDSCRAAWIKKNLPDLEAIDKSAAEVKAASEEIAGQIEQLHAQIAERWTEEQQISPESGWYPVGRHTVELQNQRRQAATKARRAQQPVAYPSTEQIDASEVR